MEGRSEGGGRCRLHPFRLADALPQVPALVVFKDGEIKYTIYSIFERHPIYEVIFFVVELLRKKNGGCHSLCHLFSSFLHDGG